MTASAFAPMQFVRINESGLTGYVIGKIEGTDKYAVQIGHHQPGMTIEKWRELSLYDGPCATEEYKSGDLTPITEDSNELHPGKKRRT